MKLQVGDVVIYHRPKHSSDGSLAVVTAITVDTPVYVTVQWITAKGIVAKLSPDQYAPGCFRKIGKLTENNA